MQVRRQCNADLPRRPPCHAHAAAGAEQNVLGYMMRLAALLLATASCFRRAHCYEVRV